MHDAHLAADSLYPSPHQPTLYMRMIHVKLNTLTVSRGVTIFFILSETSKV